jgi:hypothetical protein
MIYDNNVKPLHKMFIKMGDLNKGVVLISDNKFQIHKIIVDQIVKNSSQRVLAVEETLKNPLIK